MGFVSKYQKERQEEAAARMRAHLRKRGEIPPPPHKYPKLKKRRGRWKV